MTSFLWEVKTVQKPYFIFPFSPSLKLELIDPKMTSARVYIGNLDFEANPRDVERFFDGYGRITDVKVKKGFAFVEFENTKYAEDAIRNLDQKKLLGRPVKVEFAKASVCSPSRRHRSRSRSRSRVRSTRRDSDSHRNCSTHEKARPKSPARSRRDYGKSPIRRREHSRERSPHRYHDSSRERSKERKDRRRDSKSDYSSSTSNKKRIKSSSESSGSRSPRPRLKLGLVERIRLREALKKRQVEDGEVLSEIEELNLDRRLQSLSPIADRKAHESSPTPETLKIGSIETTPEAKSEREATDEENKVVIECPISEEEDFTEDETAAEKASDQTEKPILIYAEELKVFASSSERELSVEI